MKYRNLERVLVTGGAGFLGSHLCERLLENGAEVVCLDNLVTGSKRNIGKLLRNPNFDFVQHDVTIPFHYQVDKIFNLACPASPIHYQSDPLHTTKTNVIGALNVLELAKSMGAKVLHASTSEVYGDSQVHPQTEDYWGNVNPHGPRSCYDEGKRCAESLLFDYHRCHGVAIKIARIFNTYGPAMQPDDGRVVSNFIVQALQGEPLTIFGKGGQTRSLCFVDDMVEGFVRLMDSPDDVTGPVNLGNPSEMTVLELADRVLAITGSRSKISFHPLPIDDPVRRCPDIAKAGELLGWGPRVDLDEGLAKTIDYFACLLDAEAPLRYAPEEVPFETAIMTRQ
jgi:UDP-glucuronate decarboxylase